MRAKILPDIIEIMDKWHIHIYYRFSYAFGAKIKS